MLLLFPSDTRDDQLPRTCVLTFLSRLDPSDQQHQRFMEELVMELLRKVLVECWVDGKMEQCSMQISLPENLIFFTSNIVLILK